MEKCDIFPYPNGYARCRTDGIIAPMEEIRPSNPALFPYIESFWFLKSGDDAEPYLLPPDSKGTLIFSFRSSTTVRTAADAGYTVNGHFCTGLRSSPVTLNPCGPVDYVAVQLKPYALRSLLGIHAREAADYLVELPDLCTLFHRRALRALPDSPSPAAAVEALEPVLLEGLAGRNLVPPLYLVRGIDRITASSGSLRIRNLCDEIGITARQLEREFERWIGIPAKLFARIVRMNKALDILQDYTTPVDLADLAASLGYCDQSHMCGDFADLAGISPKQISLIATDTR